MPSGASCPLRWNDFVSTSEPHPLYRYLRGTLPFEVNFTAQGYPCQKCLRGRLGDLVKFTFSRDPRQKAFWGRLVFEVERLCVHLRALPPLQCPQRHIDFRGECHRSGQPLSEMLQRPIRESREIHLSGSPPLECLQRHIGFRGEFHRSGQPLPEPPKSPSRPVGGIGALF